MPQCPKCSAVLQEDYGMVNCPSCGKFLFIDMDGVAHMGHEATQVGTPVVDVSTAAPTPVDTDPQNPPFAFTSEAMDVPSFDAPMMAAPEAVISEPPSDFAQEAWTSEPEPVSEQPAAFSGGGVEEGKGQDGFSMDGLLGYPSEDQPASIDLGTSDEPGPPGDPLGINGFANSEISQAKDGLLVFRILILGIDSKEIRESLREAIEDVRFGWDPNAIMARIQRGALEIENVSPVKATILVNRIKRLPIKIRWEQYAITQIDEV